MDQFIAIDEEGYFVLSEGLRLSDEAVGHTLLKNLTMRDNTSMATTWPDGNSVTVEAFDKPLVAKQIFKNGKSWSLLFPYHFERNFSPESLVLDDWDRFHGLTEDKIPFVFSRAAQAEFFNLLDDYTDDTITVDGRELTVPPFYMHNDDVGRDGFWQDLYSGEAPPPWDLAGPHPALDPILPQIKIVKSRIVNFGCGKGHDAAFLAKKGHIVTGMDWSQTAIEEGKKLYGDIQSLTLQQGDVFKSDLKADVVLEHTFFCAIDPAQRKDLILKWRQTLDVGGYLLGIFFVFPRRNGPPYGSSEWELRALLEKHFRLLYWKRWEKSPERRHGTELVVFAQKLSQ